jgi:hypothetical protein
MLLSMKSIFEIDKKIHEEYARMRGVGFRGKHACLVRLNELLDLRLGFMARRK